MKISILELLLLNFFKLISILEPTDADTGWLVYLHSERERSKNGASCVVKQHQETMECMDRLYRSGGIFQSIEENPCCFWD